MPRPRLTLVARPVAAALAVALAVGGGIAEANVGRLARPAPPANPVTARGPVGWQSYRRLDLLPELRRGVVTYQDSSADPTGHNDDGYSGRYSCLHRVRLGCLMAQHTGPGELESVWTAGNQQGQSAPEGRLMVRLDGRTVVDQDWPTLTAGRPSSPFAFPLALAVGDTFGGSSLQVPMPFRHSMQVISQHNPHYEHVVFKTFSSAAGLSTGPRPDDPADVLSELRRAGTRDPKPSMGPRTVVSRSLAVRPGHRVTLADISGSGAITQLRLTPLGYRSRAVLGLDGEAADVLEHARLLISFDGQRTVDAPLGQFFGSGLGPTRVRSLMFSMQGGPTGALTSWWPMPFAQRATVVLVNDSRTTITSGRAQTTWSRDPRWRTRLAPDGGFGYFHAVSHTAVPTAGHYWTFVRTHGAGTFVGVTLTIEGGNPPIYLEGNERAYVDGARRPQIQGTGTEDFFDSGWYFYDHPFTLPLTGYAKGETPLTGCPVATCKTMYRVMIADAVPYQRSLLYEIQHGAENQVSARYSSTSYLYEARAGARRDG